MSRKTKDKIIVVTYLAGLLICIGLSIANAIMKFISYSEVFIFVTVFWAMVGILIIARPFMRLTSKNGYIFLSTTEDWLEFYRKNGFIISELQLTPYGFESMLNGEPIKLECNHIDYQLEISLRKCEKDA